MVDMKHIIYRITNLVNNRYYIGRHSTHNVNDGYMGSGKAIKNAIKKYGLENFKKEIILECSSSSDLWEQEALIVNDSVVNDPASYNMVCGGKGYLDGLKRLSMDKFLQHQSDAGKSGGIVSYYEKKTKDQRTSWHSLGGVAAAMVNRVGNKHPFYNGTAASLGGKAVKGMVELWSPSSRATNKNQHEYVPGDSKKARIDSAKYNELILLGWAPISDHKQKLMISESN